MEKKISQVEAKRLINYLHKARDYIYQLENKYGVDEIVMNVDYAQDALDSCLPVIDYAMNNSIQKD